MTKRHFVLQCPERAIDSLELVFRFREQTKGYYETANEPPELEKSPFLSFSDAEVVFYGRRDQEIERVKNLLHQSNIAFCKDDFSL